MAEQPPLFPGADVPSSPVDKPYGWFTISEIGAVIVPPVSGAIVGLAVGELMGERAAEAAQAAGTIAGPAETQPEITLIARDRDHQSRTFINPVYLGAITARVTEILERR